MLGRRSCIYVVRTLNAFAIVEIETVSTKMVSSVSTAQPILPSPSPDKAFVSVHALRAGNFTLPEYQFVQPVSRDSRKTVPSLAFLIQHQNIYTRQWTRIVFDLGLRRDINRYPIEIQKHTTTRQPLNTRPDVVESLARGGLTPDDIDFVLYSHASSLSTLSNLEN